jgi:transposase
MTQARTPVVLTPAEEVLLEQLVLARTTPAAVAIRARLLLGRHAGRSLQGCADAAHCSLSTAKRVCRRFQERRTAAVREAPRPGTGRRYSQETRAFFCTLVRSAPEQAGLPISRWSLHWLRVAGRRARWKQVPSRESLRRWLQAAHLPWHRHRSWQTSNDPAFWSKLERLRTLYENEDPELLVLAFDEKPQIQALGRRLPDCFPKPGHPRLRQHDYLRHGTVTLCCLQRLRDGRVSTLSCARHTTAVTAAFIARYLRRQPETRVALILDNLSVHTSKHFLATLQATGKEIELAFTPYYASWANSAEWYLNHLQRDLLALAVVDSVPHLLRLARHHRQLYNTHRAAPVRMPGLGRYLDRVRTSEAGH